MLEGVERISEPRLRLTGGEHVLEGEVVRLGHRGGSATEC